MIIAELFLKRYPHDPDLPPGGGGNEPIEENETDEASEQSEEDN